MPEQKASKIEPLDLNGPIATLTAQSETTYPPTATPTLLPTSTSKAVAVTMPAEIQSVSSFSNKLPAIPTLRPEMIEYKIAEGDTISKIANGFQISKKALIETNDLKNPDIISIGDVLKIPPQMPEIQDKGNLIIPDAEILYGPATLGFQLEAFLQEHPQNFLIKYLEPTPTPLPKEEQPDEPIEFTPRSGAEILEQIAVQNAINPKVLLALMEFQSGTVSNPRPNGNQKLGVIADLGFSGQSLARQLAWAADTLNDGYYQWKNNRINQWILNDDTTVAVNPEINPGTAALQYLFSRVYGKDDWTYAVSEFGFSMAYKTLFGLSEDDYFLHQELKDFPQLAFPFSPGETWSFTSGPHYGWSNGTPWSAVDFAPPDAIACGKSDLWVTASAPGEILYSNRGLVLQDLDGDQDLRTGWVLVYLHLETRDRIENNTVVKLGDKLGHPSCEGGISNGSHVHFARRYNGEWIAVEPETPLFLSDWQVVSAGTVYDGYLVKNGKTVEAWYFRTKESEISY